MIFSSTLFLFLFLPALLGLYFLSQHRLRNAILVVASLTFYAWGEPKFLKVVLMSLVLNYVLGLVVASVRQGWPSKVAIGAAVALNIGLLGYFKYADFIVENLNHVLASTVPRVSRISLPKVALPLGISFFTFHALSYVIDVHRKQTPPQRNPLRLALYILFFPQLIAGPIVRYHEIAHQLERRYTTSAEFARGVERFVMGLGKKILIANIVAEVADAIFDLGALQLSPGLAWLGAVAYALQIYFDFSGYSDMAIGLALMFGFKFPENFNYPYVAQSITEFWRRWHMPLSRWFRDYLYIPLGGNRQGSARLYANLVTVFLLCGLWHGASWHFVLWGVLHGALLVLERVGLMRLLERAGRPLRHAYCLLAVLVTWVFFRANTIEQAFVVLRALFGVNGAVSATARSPLFINAEHVLALVVGLACSIPLHPWFRQQRVKWTSNVAVVTWECARVVGLQLILFAAAMRLSSGTYNPFIYFRF